MGEIFKRTKPAVPLPWTGERLTSEAGQQVEIEHLHRYLLARTICRGLDVLDVAAGEGYGSALIAQSARSVTGLELDSASVRHARDSYTATNLRFLQGDARCLPMADACVDAVVSFETIEHFHEHAEFLAQIRRVLRPGGLLIISSPERDAYSPAGQPPNPYHVHELTRSEFIALLESYFRNVTVLGQRALAGSAIVVESGRADADRCPLLTFERRGSDWFEASEGLTRALYLVAIASDQATPNMRDSLYIDSHIVEADNSDKKLSIIQDTLNKAETYARSVEAAYANSQLATAHAKGETIAAREQADTLAARLADAEVRSCDLQVQLETSRLAEAESRSCELQARMELAAAQEQMERFRAGQSARDRALIEAARVSERLRRERLAAIAKVDEFQVRANLLEAELARVRQLEETLAESQQLLRAKLEHRTADFERISSELGTVLNSSTWRALRPARSLLSRSPAVRRILRRTAKMAWWTVTLQLSRIRLHLPPPFGRRSMVLPAELPTVAASPPLPPPVIPGAIFPVDVPTAPAELDHKAFFQMSARAELQDFLTSGERLAFPQTRDPDISIVIVLWNKAHLTLRCLRALIGQIGPSFEVVIVDNASSDETPALLARLDGVRILPNSINDGFLLGCNRGAHAACGRTVLFLNNDAFLRPGALAAALGTLDVSPDIGAVGGRLVLPSGVLQEAGSLVWSDGSALGYGRGLAEDAGEAMFRRDVDFCSGAFLLTHRTIWNELGGFSPIYQPAYYEEADYCLRLQQIGRRIVYEPAVVIDHYEFGSEAKRGEAVALMLRNRKVFRTRHSFELSRNHLPPAPANILAARDRLRPGQRRLLMIDNEVPLRVLGAGYPRAREMICQAVAAGWSVTLYPLHQLWVDWDMVRPEIPWEVEIVTGYGLPRLAEFLRDRRGHYEATVVSRPNNMRWFRDTLRQQPDFLDSTRLIYDAEALFASRDASRAVLLGAPLSAEEIEARTSNEVELAEHADAVICVNQAEADAFRVRHRMAVHILSHPAKLRVGTGGFQGRSGFLFVGRLLEREVPNWQGLSWFVRECWPFIRAALPEVTLSVAGHLHPEHDELVAPGVELLGPIADLGPLYDAARLFVAPIQWAAGVPIKVLEAAGAGLPTVGTRLMAQQLCWTSGVEIVAHDNSGALATAAVNLYSDPIAWEKMRVTAQARIENEHGTEVFRRRLEALLDGVPSSPS